MLSNADLLLLWDDARSFEQLAAYSQIPVVLDGAGRTGQPSRSGGESLARSSRCCAQHRNSAASSRTPIPSTARTGSCC